MQFFFLFYCQCLGRYVCGRNLKIKFPLDFHNYSELNRLANSFSYFTIASPNMLILGCKPRWSAKSKKKSIMWEVVPGKCSAKTPSRKFHKIYKKISLLEFSPWRSSLPVVFCKKEVLENFSKFKGLMTICFRMKLL